MNESTEEGPPAEGPSEEGPPEEGPSVSRLAGQLEYLFEEHPEFRHVAVAELVTRLNEEDRWARAIARYPSRSDAEVHGHLAEFHDRIGAVEVEQARQQVLARTDEPEERPNQSI